MKFSLDVWVDDTSITTDIQTIAIPENPLKIFHSSCWISKVFIFSQKMWPPLTWHWFSQAESVARGEHEARRAPSFCGSIFGARETLWAFRCLRLRMLVQTQGKILLKGFQDKESHDWLRDSQGALRYSTYSKFRWNPSMSTWLKLLDVRQSLKIMHPGSLDFFVGDFLSIFYHSKLSYIIFQGPSGKYILPGKFDSETPGLDGPDCFCPWVSMQINGFCYNITAFFCDLKTRLGQLEEFSLCWLFSCILKPKNSTFRLGILRYLKYLLKLRCFMKYPSAGLHCIMWPIDPVGAVEAWIVFHCFSFNSLILSCCKRGRWQPMNWFNEMMKFIFHS